MNKKIQKLNINDCERIIKNEFTELNIKKQSEFDQFRKLIHILLRNNMSGLLSNIKYFLSLINKIGLTDIKNSLFYNLYNYRLVDIVLISNNSEEYIFDTQKHELYTLQSILNKITTNSVRVISSKQLLIKKSILLEDYKIKLSKELEYVKNICKQDISLIRQKLKKKYWKNLSSKDDRNKFLKHLDKESVNFKIK